MESETEKRATDKEKLLEMEAKLLAAEQSKSEAISEAGSYKEKLQHQFTEQLAEYKVSIEVWMFYFIDLIFRKEQAQQYALTIVALEEKLLKLMETSKTLQVENQSLTKHLEDATTSSTLTIQSMHIACHHILFHVDFNAYRERRESTQDGGAYRSVEVSRPSLCRVTSSVSWHLLLTETSLD